MRILKAILSKDPVISADSVGRAANSFMGADLNKLQYTRGMV